MTVPLSAFGLPSEVVLWQALFLTLLSYGVGVVGGAVGLALGTMRLPFLLLLGMPAPVAAGTNILVSTLSAVTGLIRHLKEGRVDFGVVAVQGIPAVIGAFIGGFASGLAPESLLIGLAGILVIWQGLELLLRARRQRPKATPVLARSTAGSRIGSWSAGQIFAEALVGFAIGLLGGAVGLILGSLRLPALITILGIDPRVAAGSNLVIGFLMGAFGWVGHVVAGQVDYPLLVLMGLTGMAGTFQGARLTGTMSLRGLLMVMALVLLVVGSLLLWDAARRAAVMA
ncbi:MAG: sulfite exporter TauE/SafE family protein [Candidatus Rokubacteria bacterium]|nr:sulfite exporter TauE/SafE family protein [Candidatus Rokubacteria bacterium]